MFQTRGIFARNGGMLPLVLALLALAALTFSLLTVRPVPAAVNWKCATLAGEYGYLLSLVPLGVAAAAWFSRAGLPWLTAFTVVACWVAALLFWRPVFQAREIAKHLPARLIGAFGPMSISRRPFAWLELLHFASRAGPIQRHAFTPDLALDFYPANPSDDQTDPAPCVIVIHGGGWEGGNRRQLVGLNHWLTRQGYAVAAISYRLAPAHPWPAQRDDTLAAIAWLKSHASQLGFDPARLVLLGRSAGGQIATAVGYLGDPAIRGVVAFYAPHDMPFTWSVSRADDALNSLKLMTQFLGGPPEGRGELYASASGQALVRAGITPPTLLMHGTIDTLAWVRHSERLAAALQAARVPRIFVELPWATHGFEVNPGGPGGQLARFALDWFLTAVTK
jgi:acetyl esterase/lipase